MPEILKRLMFIPVAIFFLTVDLSAQQPDTNLDIFYSMIDSSVTDFISKVPQSEESIKLDLNLGKDYSVFTNKVIAKIISLGKKISNEKNDESSTVNYIINKADVTYDDIYRDGFFGGYYLPRTLSLKGNYTVESDSTVLRDFSYSYNDTLKYDDIRNVENDDYPFTKGEVPPEPFLSSLFEPIVAVGAAAVAVILFFTVRSK
jgi:hypothetical protein